MQHTGSRHGPRLTCGSTRSSNPSWNRTKNIIGTKDSVANALPLNHTHTHTHTRTHTHTHTHTASVSTTTLPALGTAPACLMKVRTRSGHRPAKLSTHASNLRKKRDSVMVTARRVPVSTARAAAFSATNLHHERSAHTQIQHNVPSLRARGSIVPAHHAGCCGEGGNLGVHILRSQRAQPNGVTSHQGSTTYRVTPLGACGNWPAAH